MILKHLNNRLYIKEILYTILRILLARPRFKDFFSLVIQSNPRISEVFLLLIDLTQNRNFTKMRSNLSILDKANELMNKQVWAAAQVADRLSSSHLNALARKVSY